MNPDDEAPGTDAAPEPSEDAYRIISEKEFTRILAAHEIWATTQPKGGEYADLSRADLSGKWLVRQNLQEANLQEANLRFANLQGADLRGAKLMCADHGAANLSHANLQKADLTGATLQGADLSQANLQHTDLTDANLRETDLSNAKLADVAGLLSEKLAGAILTNTKLPEDIKAFDGLEHAAETSRNARKIFVGLLAACAYSWLTIVTTTDAQLLPSSTSTPLPIIQTKVPIAGFYWAAPLILLGLYSYLHLYMQRLWRALGTLPAVFPDGKPLDEKAYPWLLNGLVRAHLPRLSHRRPPLSRLENVVAIALAWWAVPLTLTGFWIRYLPRHDWGGAVLLTACLLLAAGFGIATFRIMRRTLRGVGSPEITRTRGQRLKVYSTQAAMGAAAVILAFVINDGAINGVSEWSLRGDAHLMEMPPHLATLRTWVPKAFSFLGYRSFANLSEADVSTKPANWTGSDDPKTAKREIAQVKGADLQGADLSYADAFRSFLANADLRNAKAQGAYFSFANFQGANLSFANLQRAYFWKANLQWADLTMAKLPRSDLSQAKLQGAVLTGAELQGADLRGANLHGSVLGCYVHWGCTDLTGAAITPEQLATACGPAYVIFPDHFPDDFELKPCMEQPTTDEVGGAGPESTP